MKAAAASIHAKSLQLNSRVTRALSIAQRNPEDRAVGVVADQQSAVRRDNNVMDGACSLDAGRVIRPEHREAGASRPRGLTHRHLMDRRERRTGRVPAYATFPTAVTTSLGPPTSRQFFLARFSAKGNHPGVIAGGTGRLAREP